MQLLIYGIIIGAVYISAKFNLKTGYLTGLDILDINTVCWSKEVAMNTSPFMKTVRAMLRFKQMDLSTEKTTATIY